MANSPKGVLPPAWLQVLKDMQQSLTQALAAVPEPTDKSSSSVQRLPPWQATLERLNRRLGELETCSRKAIQSAEARDDDLAASMDGLRKWLADAGANRQALAERSGEPL
jgi:hypothetical protein